MYATHLDLTYVVLFNVMADCRSVRPTFVKHPVSSNNATVAAIG